MDLLWFLNSEMKAERQSLDTSALNMSSSEYLLYIPRTSFMNMKESSYFPPRKMLANLSIHDVQSETIAELVML